ncbi:flagellar hook-length control protein FliK [Selenomonas sp.]|uniref:flagellar hook-length control protein FliK n=1 Tax=Selenomonas sp. TaxID=2053611 RepID=UPI003A101F8A
MNTTQIMSVAPQAGTTKAAAAGSTTKLPRVQGKDAASDKGGDSFGSALEKTQSQDTAPAKAETAGRTSPQEQAAAQETAVAEATGGKGKAKELDKPSGKAAEADDKAMAESAEGSVLAAFLAAEAIVPEQAAAQETAVAEATGGKGKEPNKPSGKAAEADDKAMAESAEGSVLAAFLAAEAIAPEQAAAQETAVAEATGGKGKEPDKPSGKAAEADDKAMAESAEGSVLAAFLAAEAIAPEQAAAPEETAAQLLTAGEPPATDALQTLLPQDTAVGTSQKKLLAMLAGQSFPAAEKAQQSAAVSVAGQAAQQPARKAASLAASAQEAELPAGMQPGGQRQSDIAANLLSQLPAADRVVRGSQPLLSDAVQSAPSPQAVVQNVQVGQTVAAQTAGTAAQTPERTVQVSDFANLFGTQIQVDGAQPVQPVAAAMQPDDGGSLLQQGQQQSLAQSFGQGTGLPQLPEEVALDKAPAQQTTDASAMGATGVMTFSQTLAQVEPAAAAAPQVMPQTDYEVPRQIVDQARLIQRGQDTEMVIHLKPEHLGDLTLRVSVGTDGAVNASFHSNNAEVRTIIENTLVQLRQELNNQGLKVDNVGVYAGLADGGLPQDQGQQQAFQQGSQRQHTTRESAAAFEDGQELAAALAAQEGNIATDGVDYRI